MDNPFSGVKNIDSQLPNLVADQISQLIISKRYQPGDKLPNEFELCGLLGVGRGSVREAVKILVARNVLEIQRGKGTFVSEHLGEIDDPLGFAFFPDQNALGKDLLEVRTFLEPWVAGLAARRATEEDLEAIRFNCQRVEELIAAGQNHLSADVQFHMSIAKCTQNLVVPKLIPIITYSVGLFGRLTQMSLLEDTVIDHRNVVEAICARDSEAASAAMLAHMKKNQQSLDKRLSEAADTKDAH